MKIMMDMETIKMINSQIIPPFGKMQMKMVLQTVMGRYTR